MLADSRIWPTCLSSNSLNASTSFSLSLESSRISRLSPVSTSEKSLTCFDISKYIRLILECNGISEGFSKLIISSILPWSLEISRPRVERTKSRKTLLWIRENSLFEDILILSAPDKYAAMRWSKIIWSGIISQSIFTSLFLSKFEVSAITLRAPEGLHSILISSLASRPCSIIHFLGRLTVYVEPPVSWIFLTSELVSVFESIIWRLNSTIYNYR